MSSAAPRIAAHPRKDRRNPGLGGPTVRRQLARELPGLPRELAARADVLTLTFLAAQLLGRPDPDPKPDPEPDDATPQATR